MQWVLQQVESAGCHLNLVFLDCCRSKPPKVVSTSKALARGLAKIDVPTGTLISFACAPDSVASDGEPGRNGPYTEQLLKHLPRADDLQKVLGYVVSGVQKATNGAQVPWMSGTLARDPDINNGDVFLIEPGSSQNYAAPQAAQQSTVDPLENACKSGADVAGLTQWLARIGLANHEVSVIPKLCSAGVLKVGELEELKENSLEKLGLPFFEQQKIADALKALAAERAAKEERERRAKAQAEQIETERKAKEERERRAKAEAERIEAERKAKEERERKANAEADRLERERRAREDAERKAREAATAVTNAIQSIPQYETTKNFAQLVAAMRAHASNADVQHRGCGALWNMTVNADNKVKAGSAGAIEAVVASMCAHTSNAVVQHQGCGALWNMTVNADNQAKAGNAGAIEAVVAGMRAHTGNADVQHRGCGALLTMPVNADNRVKAGSAGAIEAVVAGMRAHTSNKDVQQNGCWALDNMTWENANLDRARRAGAVEAANAAMKAHPSGFFSKEHKLEKHARSLLKRLQ